MSKSTYAGLLAAAAAATLCACAANTPAAKQAPARSAEPATSSATAVSKPATTARNKNYRSVVKDGQTYFCRRETITGSRTQAVETCLTQAQLDAELARSQELIRRVESTPNTGGGVDAQGGTSMGVMRN